MLTEKKNDSHCIVLVKEHEEYIGDVFTISKGICTLSHEEWILDSGYHVHIYSREKYFDTFQERKIYIIYLDDVSTCDITGVMIVKIKMFKEVVSTFSGVAYGLKIQGI